MSYLFERQIPKYNKEMMDSDPSRYAKLEYVNHLCMSKTQELVNQHGRDLNKTDDTAAAITLVQQMGEQFKVSGRSHASDYISNWRMVSGNASVVTQLVLGELERAYQIGLNTREPAVIGVMFQLAVLIWSEIGQYTGNAQNDPRR